MLLRLQFSIAAFLRDVGKHAFIIRLGGRIALLDVGCGNNSPYKLKQVHPDCHYTGIDIGDYNQAKPNLADQYILTTPERFASDIAQFKNHFDAIISSHNLEHCNDRKSTLAAMLGAVKVGGRLYLSFPCEESVNFPPRTGTLNYCDDKTHVPPPPNFDQILDALRQSSFDITVQVRRYRPLILRCLGFVLEPFSAMKKRVLRGTWEYYGFESVIWAVKKQRE